jgi:hypothetical protein
MKRFVSLQFLNLRQSVGLLRRGISPSQGRYLTQTQNTQTSMPWEGFEPTTPVFERAKTFYALERAATVISTTWSIKPKWSLWRIKHHDTKMYGGVEVQLLVYLTSAVDCGEWSALCPERLIPRESNPSVHWMGGGGSRASSDAVKKRAPLALAMNPNPIPRSSSLQSSFSADWTIRTPILVVRKKWEVSEINYETNFVILLV